MTKKKSDNNRDEPDDDARLTTRGADRPLRLELGLADLRAHLSLTQAQVAQAIGTTQSAISRLERQPDLLVSTLGEYINATGGRLRLIADYGTNEVDLDLPAIRAEPVEAEREFRVVWQNLQTRQLVHVGWLHVGAGRYAFEYTPDADLDRDFQPFVAFPDLQRRYEANDLFPFFAHRVVATAEPGYDDLIHALGLSRDTATPTELLARSWGRSTHDTIQIVPEPELHSDGSSSRLFLVSGVSHADEDHPDRVSKVVTKLKTGQRLDLRDEPDNPVDSQAITIETGGQRLGWIPAYLLGEVHKARERIDVFVERANGPRTPWHLRLLCRLVVAPEPVDR
ncbi:MAG TPA: helix-turn-helix domain-containing protein [Acidimicrobiales bacterium]|nr:helix-turn-helix domain-containing protein [Acidimicrobiales bacterium]